MLKISKYETRETANMKRTKVNTVTDQQRKAARQYYKLDKAIDLAAAKEKYSSARIYKSEDGQLTMSCGNLKLDKSITILNLNAVKTCPNCKTCKDDCFAIKSEKQYPKVAECRARNTAATKREDFPVIAKDLIEQTGNKRVRIHESGDIYNQEYCDKLTALANSLPNIQFYAYTKTNYRPNAKNFNIVESILPNGQRNFGTMDYILNAAKTFNAVICPCGIEETSNKICGVNCTACASNKNVVFLQH